MIVMTACAIHFNTCDTAMDNKNKRYTSISVPVPSFVIVTIHYQFIIKRTLTHLSL